MATATDPFDSAQGTVAVNRSLSPSAEFILSAAEGLRINSIEGGIAEVAGMSTATSKPCEFNALR